MDKNSATNPPVFAAVDLRCVRGDRELFSDLSFELRPGDILHISGANGSGKSSLLRMMAGLRNFYVICNMWVISAGSKRNCRRWRICAASQPWPCNPRKR